MGGLLAPLFAPWASAPETQAAVALLTGLVAKEMVVSSMSMFYGFSVTASGAAIAAALGGTFQSPGRLFFPGVCPALCALRGGGVHHPQGDELHQMDPGLHRLAAGAAWLGSFLVYQLGSLVLRVIGC